VRALGILRGRLTDAPRAWRILQPFIAGALVGMMGLIVPQVMGAGYGAIDNALHDEFGWKWLLVLGAAKVAATAICFAAGTPGGMFAPTLFIGAMIGGGVGGLAGLYWPLPTSQPSAYVLVGMGTFFAAVFRAPMTSVFMVFEVSASYVIILPVMVANLIAYLVARRLNPVTFFDMVAAQDGVQLPSQERERESRPYRVEDAMEPADPGDIDLSAIGAPVPILHPDQTLDAALRRFGSYRVLPVVSRRDLTEVLGTLSVDDVLRVYGIRDAGPQERAAAEPPPAAAPYPPK
jgi:CIC family chloride channel protein